MQVYSQDEDEEKEEKSTIAKENTFFSSRYNQELKKMKADQSPRQEDTGLLSPLGKLLTRNFSPDCDLDNRNPREIHQEKFTYHEQLLKQSLDSSQNIGKASEDISSSKLNKGPYQKTFCSRERSVSLALPEDSTAQRKKHIFHQCKDPEKIHKPVSDHKDQSINHQCKGTSFICSFKTTSQNGPEPDKTYGVRKIPTEILEEVEVRPETYLSKDKNHSPGKDPIKVKLDIQATVETLHMQRFSTSPESSPFESAKSPSKEKRSSKDRDKYSIFAKVCTNEPHHKHRRLSVDSAMSENSVSFCGYRKNGCNSYNKFQLFAQHRHGQSCREGSSCTQSCREGGSCTQSKQNEGSGFSRSIDAIMQNALITSPRFRYPKVSYKF